MMSADQAIVSGPHCLAVSRALISSLWLQRRHGGPSIGLVWNSFRGSCGHYAQQLQAVEGASVSTVLAGCPLLYPVVSIAAQTHA